MNKPHRSAAALTVLALTLLASCVSRPPGTVNDSGLPFPLSDFREDFERAGTLVYEGGVYPMEPVTSERVFSYERRVRDQSGGQLSSHITFDADRQVLVIQSALHTPDYRLVTFQVDHWQAGYSGSVEVKGDQVQFTWAAAGGLTSVRETVDRPVVVGPTLYGFIRAHWQELSNGRSLSVRFAAVDFMQTFGFSIRRLDDQLGAAVFEMRPEDFFVSLGLAPFRIVFDASTGRLQSYQGRVPPLRLLNGKLRDFDARVLYEVVEAPYR